METTELPKTRSEALKSGSSTYYTSKPCKRNHLSPRHTLSGNCISCKAELNKAKGWVNLGPAKARLLNNTVTLVIPSGMVLIIKQHQP